MTKAQKPTDIDGYISQFPADVQAVLRGVQEAIRRAAPEAEETISYQMPALRQHGILVYFAAWKKHVGLYPPISGDKALEQAVARYAGPKGNLQFPLDEPIEPFAFELQRCMKHVHVGPYQELPQQWKDLQAELVSRGEVIGSPSLEIYGHH